MLGRRIVYWHLARHSGPCDKSRARWRREAVGYWTDCQRLQEKGRE